MPDQASMSELRPNPSIQSPKIRISCETCAESKIGCTKEKPTCSRCKKRGKTCVYAVTKRSGRPSKSKRRWPPSPTPLQTESRTSSETSSQSSDSLTSRSSCAARSNDMTDKILSHSTMSDAASPATMTTGTASVFKLPQGILQQSPSSCLSDRSVSLNTMATSASTEGNVVRSLPSMDQTQFQLLTASPQLSSFDNDPFNWGSYLFQTSIDKDKNDIHEYEKQANSTYDLCSYGFNEGNLDGGALSRDDQRTAATPADLVDWLSVADGPENNGLCLDSGISTSQDCFLPTPQSFHDLRLSRDCLTRCLLLLEQLTPPSTISCTQNTENYFSAIPISFESILTQNQTAIDAVGDMLQCPCSRNAGLMFTIAMVIFKVLGWYAACANAASRAPTHYKWDTSESGSSTTPLRRKPPIVSRPLQYTLRDYGMDGDCETRVICRIVFSRLQNVLHPVNILTQRLTELKHNSGTPQSSAEHVAPATLELLLDGPALNISNSLGQSLANNLKWHLQYLCEAIVSNLSKTE